MRVIIADPQNGLTRLKHVVPLPLDPTVRVTGIVAGTPRRRQGSGRACTRGCLR